MKKENNLKYLTLTGMMAALITLFTAYFVHIPMGPNGGYLHLGDSLIYVAAALLPWPYAMLAGAIGGGLADLLTAPMWTIATVIIKALIVIPFTSRKSKILCGRNWVAPIISFLISGTGYYTATRILFGSATAILTSFTGSFAQSFSSALVFYVLGAALDKAGVKSLVASFGAAGKWNEKEGQAHG